MSKQFQLLGPEEFANLTTEERIAYLREAIRAMEELKSRLTEEVMRETSRHILRKVSAQS